MDFVHLHNHTEFSLLDGAAKIEKLMKKASALKMPAVAITDHGNMFGAFKFVAEAAKNNLKAIVGCEFYLVEDRAKKQFTKGNGDRRYHQLLLAKDQAGYQNLSKLCSLGYLEGLYSKWPRIDKELILQYHEGLIATTCCLGAEVPQAILNLGEAEAEKIFKWWLDIFGEDYYIEIQRHGLEEQTLVNEVLLRFAKKYNVKVIATNDSHYVEKTDYMAHDILLCINTGDTISVPVGDKNEDEDGKKGSQFRFVNEKGEFFTASAEDAQYKFPSDPEVTKTLQRIQEANRKMRFGFPNNQFYFKTGDEMAKLFADVPEALENTLLVADKITPPKLKRDILLPNFPLPEGFKDNDEYLEHISWEGARKKYKEITLEIEERLKLELGVVRSMGFAGYFLIVSDFIQAGRDLGVLVGPGRGSAAGSAVAFCIGITNIDPIKYNLLFERFLNPERVSMPDIDTDFDDEGRQKVIDYVVDKYGRKQVAQIITYGSMAAKLSIRDVARALELPLPEAMALAKLVPERPGTTLEKAYQEVPELWDIRKGTDLRAKVLETAEILEGSVRNTGVHAAGIIIAPADITKYIPVAISKDSDLLLTQFEGKVIEEAGMLKMDFLGLKTLSIIKTALELIKEKHNVEIDIDNIPLDDTRTFEMYQRGDTVGTFQFESDGMRKYLRELKPTSIEDLIAMNALYRPGPMDYIPTFISRKQGREKVEFPHVLLEPILKPTYGIMVYQEQIMQTAQIIAGYSLGGADLLRRAMGKKDKEKMAKERVKFVDGALKINDIPAEKANEIFDIMEKFAEYGFNRSHSAAYSVVAFQTAYLKANYTAEYMAAVLTHNVSDISKITFFIEECQHLGAKVLSPSVNESKRSFAVNANGEIRFGLAAMKGVGGNVCDSIITERLKNGPFKNIFDFTSRVPAGTVNRKAMESLVYGGAFDCFEGVHRAQYFYSSDGGATLLFDKALQYGSKLQEEKRSNQASLFGGSLGNGNGSGVSMEPRIPDSEVWDKMTLLNHEKGVIGFYLSGHPLEEYSLEINSFTNCALGQLDQFKGQTLRVAGIVSSVKEGTTKRGTRFCTFVLEDMSGTKEIALFGDDYAKFRGYVAQENLLFITAAWVPSFRDPKVNEPKVKTINFLADVSDQLAKKISLSFGLHQLNSGMVEKLEHLFKDNKGNCTIEFVITDPDFASPLLLSSRTARVKPNLELFRGLETIPVAFELK